MITSPEQAQHILATGQADVVLLARELLRNPYWPLHAAHILKQNVQWPKQYLRARPQSTAGAHIRRPLANVGYGKRTQQKRQAARPASMKP